MKLLATLLLSLTMALPLGACGQPAANVAPPPLPDAPALLTAEVLSVTETTILLAQTGEEAGSADLYTIPAATTFNGEGSVVSEGDLRPGMLVTVGHSGDVMETYPAQLDALWYRVTDKGNGLTAMVLETLERLMRDDTALNDDCKYLAFDLTGATCLTEARKSGIVYQMSAAHGLEPVLGTFDELCDSGYIDRENLYFPEGLLLTFAVEGEEKADAFTFHVSKWRSGLGAIGMSECKATLKNGAWTYEPGVQWIS